MYRKVSGWLALVLAAFVLQVPAAAPAAAAWKPPEGAVFNVPAPWGTTAQRLAILNRVETAIDNATAGSTILVATYLFDKKSSVDALINACKRGVSVRVILDGLIATDQSRRLIGALNGDNRSEDGSYVQPGAANCRGEANRTAGAPDPMTGEEAVESVDEVTDARITWGDDRSYVTKCVQACRGAGTSMHGKFYVFSKVGTPTDYTENVIMVSSSNLNRGGVSRGWNDLYTLHGTPEHYQRYRQVHLEMTDEQRVPSGQGPAYNFTDGNHLSRFFPWTDAGKASDPVLKDLDKVSCAVGPLGPTTVHVSQFWIKGDRGNWIVDELLALARDGCRVSIIYGAPSVQIATRLRAAAKKRLISLYDSRWWLDSDPEVDVRTHAKYVLVKGGYAGDPSSHQVLTGTANWSPGSLARVDENSLNIASAAAWNQYIDNWHTIRQHSRKLPKRG